MQALRAGAQDYLVKQQVDARGLLRTVRFAIEQRRMTRDLELARRREHFLATHDGVTGLANRSQFCSRTAKALDSDPDRAAAILVLDLDRFQAINESLGHAAGDALLRRVGERLSGCVAGTQCVARLGGDEFIVLAHGLPRALTARAVAERVLRSLDAPFNVGDGWWSISASVGVSVFPLDGDEPERLIANASAAMLQAKRIGGNSYRVFESESEGAVLRRRELTSQLQGALEAGEFEVHYQPLVALGSGEVRGAEALVRWMHPVWGLIGPDEFISEAEDSGLIGRLGEWVLRAACEQRQAWLHDGLHPLRLAVNLSPQQLVCRGLAGRIESILAETGMDPDFLDLEITEHGLISDFEQSARTLEALRQIGVRVSIDDFGTGHASLSYLQRLPLDTLKIDRSFVGLLETDAGAGTITAAILSMARRMNLQTVAEGVETNAQLDFLRLHRCTDVQGFLFGKAVPGGQFIDLCRRVDRRL